MSRMESCSTVSRFSYDLRLKLWKIPNNHILVSYPGVRIVQHHEDDEDTSAACCTHSGHYPLLSLQEEPPTIRHDHKQLGCLYGGISQISLRLDIWWVWMSHRLLFSSWLWQTPPLCLKRTNSICLYQTFFFIDTNSTWDSFREAELSLCRSYSFLWVPLVNII